MLSNLHNFSKVGPSPQTQLLLRKAGLLADIRSTFLLCDKPFFTGNPSAWETLLPPNWTAEDQPPLGMLQILRATTTPVWAVSTIVSKQLAELQMVYSTFQTKEAFIQGLISNPPTTNAHTTTDAIKTKITELEGEDWPAQLAKASRELTKVCLYNHTLSLLFHAKNRAQSSTLLILQYETVLRNLHLLRGTRGIMMTHKSSHRTRLCA